MHVGQVFHALQRLLQFVAILVQRPGTIKADEINRVESTLLVVLDEEIVFCVLFWDHHQQLKVLQEVASGGPAPDFSFTTLTQNDSLFLLSWAKADLSA